MGKDTTQGERLMQDTSLNEKTEMLSNMEIVIVVEIIQNTQDGMEVVLE